MGLPIDNTPIRPPTEEEKIKLEALNLEIPAHDDQNELLFHNRLKKVPSLSVILK